MTPRETLEWLQARRGANAICAAEDLALGHVDRARDFAERYVDFDDRARIYMADVVIGDRPAVTA